MSTPENETQVLIVGGGPTGLTAGIELGTRGIDCTILEPRTSVSHHHPKARTTSIRTMEHFRRLEIADRLRDAANIPVEWSQEAVFCTSLLGRELCRLDNITGLEPGQQEDFVEPAQEVAQYHVEEVLRERIGELPSVTFATGWQLESIDQTEDEVRAVATTDEQQQKITATYAIGSDGSKSTVRDQIGAEYIGESDPRENVSIIFSAPDLLETQPHGPAVQYWVINESVPGLLGPLDLDDRWMAFVMGYDEFEQSDPREYLHEIVDDSIDFEVLGTYTWSSNMVISDKVRDGRIFLAGDAVNLIPPWGGLGYNTGVGDAVDIGWKLTAVLNNWGGPELLDSYESERRPIWERLIDVTSNMEGNPGNLMVPDMDADGERGKQARQSAVDYIRQVMPQVLYTQGISLGYRYDGSPLVVEEDEEPQPPKDSSEYVPTTYPGARLPHTWLGEGHSVYDELGDEFSLLRLDSEVDTEPLETAAADWNIPLKVVNIDDRAYRKKCGYPLILVRPDQHVAWRGETCPDNPDGILKQVAGRTDIMVYSD